MQAAILNTQTRLGLDYSSRQYGPPYKSFPVYLGLQLVYVVLVFIGKIAIVFVFLMEFQFKHSSHQLNHDLVCLPTFKWVI